MASGPSGRRKICSSTETNVDYVKMEIQKYKDNGLEKCSYEKIYKKSIL